MSAEKRPDAKKKRPSGFLATIERVGNKVPHPAILFFALCIAIIILSQILAAIGVSATYDVVQPPEAAQSVDPGLEHEQTSDLLPSGGSDSSQYHVVKETVSIRGLLGGDGVRYLFTSFVGNFMGFTALGIILIVMIGVGVAESTGLIAALIRKLVKISSPAALTYIIVFLGILSSVASDAGYLVLIPLGALAYKSIGKNPMAGIAVAFAGVAGGFGVNLLITPLDAVLTEITNESVHLVNPSQSIGLTANLWYSIAVTFFLTLVIGLTARFVERRLGVYDPQFAPEPGGDGIQTAEAPQQLTPEQESKGLKWSGILLAIGVVAIVLLTFLPGAPLRDPKTGGILGDSPFMNSLIPIISLLFLLAGVGFGRGTGQLRSATDVINAVTKSWASLAGLLLLFLLISQFIAYFSWSNIPQVAAVRLGDLIESMNIGTVWLMIIVILITLVVDIIIPQAIAKWALLAPIFVPLFLRLGTDPAALLATYRLGDSPMNLVTPIMAYFPLVVVFASRYDKRSGIGTIIALMLPYTVVIAVTWLILHLIWYLVGIPWGL